MTLEKLFFPRKAPKTRNKLIYDADLAIHPLGSNLRTGISLNISAVFVFFVDKLRLLL